MLYSQFGLTGPQDPRAIRAAAVSDPTQQNAPTPQSTQAQTDEYWAEQVDQNKVDAALKAAHPELYATEDQLRQKAQVAGERQGLSGVQLKNYTTYTANQMLKTNQAQLSSLRNQEIQKEATALHVQSANQANTTAKSANANISTNTSGTIGSSLTSEQASNMNQVESLLQSQLQSNPGAASVLQNNMDYIQQISSLPPDQQAALVKQLQDAATAVDPYFTQRENDLKTKLTERIQKLNDLYGAMNAQELQTFKETVRNLDLQSAQTLSNNLQDLTNRGAIDSGLLNNIASTVIEQQGYGLSDAQNTYNNAITKNNLSAQDLAGYYQAMVDPQIMSLEDQRVGAEDTAEGQALAQMQAQQMTTNEQAGTYNPTVTVTPGSMPSSSGSTFASQGTSSTTPPTTPTQSTSNNTNVPTTRVTQNVGSTPPSYASPARTGSITGTTATNPTTPTTPSASNPATTGLTPVQMRAQQNAIRLQSMGYNLNSSGQAALNY